MKRWLFAAAAILCASAAFAVNVAPAVIPRITFVDASGLPCAGCKLSTYAAGTTNHLATYTDSTGTSQKTNPIVLDAAGGANIWLGSNSYKFILKDTSGSTIWSVDSVNAGNLFPCSSPMAVQVASGTSGLTCDANITINTTNHTLSIGSLGAHYVTIGALGTPTSWTFDTTSPATALASLGGGTVNSGTANQIAFYSSSGNAVSGSSYIPNGIFATTQSPSDNSGKVATTAFVATPGAIHPTSLQVGTGGPVTGNQGNGLLVQHSTGATVSGHGAAFDANGNVIDAGTPYPVGTPRTCNSNGCYSISGDGTITAYGQSTSASGGTAGIVTITFPTTFTSATNLQVVLTPVGQPAGDGNPHPLDCHLNAAPSVSGATAVIALPTQVSGSGYSSLTGQYCAWHATGY